MSKKIKTIKKEKNYSSDSEELSRMLKILLGVVLVLAAFYFVYAIMSGEISFGSKKKNVEIQNEEILAGTTFNRPESEYYVLYFDFDGNSAEKTEAYYSIYRSAIAEYKVFVVDLNKKFNSTYVVEDRSLINTSNVESLKVMDPTLLFVKDGQVTKTLVGLEEIEKEWSIQK